MRLDPVAQPPVARLLTAQPLCAGAFPTHTLRNLQRLYGLLPGINVAVKVPPRGVKKPIRVLGVFGDTVARMTRKARACGFVA